MQTLYLNGRFMPLAEANIPVTDRGMMFADGVYEMIAVYNGHPRRLEAHLDRLDDSLSGIRLRNPYSRPQWTELIRDVIARNGGGDLSLYLQITRGDAPRDHAFPEPTEPTVMVLPKPLKREHTLALREGVRAITCEDLRWDRCAIKSINLLPNVMARQEAREAGAHEAILHRDGMVTEGAASNVYAIIDGTPVTPPLSNHILPGITRDLLMTLAQDVGRSVVERPLSVAELQNAEEIWLTSTTRELLPVTHLDGQRIGAGGPGPKFRAMAEAYDDYVEALRLGYPERRTAR